MLLRPKKTSLLKKINGMLASVGISLRKNRWRLIALFLVPLAIASVAVPSAEQIMVAIESMKPIEQREKEAAEAAYAFRQKNLDVETDKDNKFEVSDVNKFSDLKPIPESAKVAKESVEKKKANEGTPTAEVESKRTENSRTYKNSLGGEVTIASPTEQNYLNENNKLVPISTAPEVDSTYKTGLKSIKELELSSDKPAAYKNTKGSLQAHYLPLNDGGIKITYEDASFTINPDTKSFVSPSKSDKSDYITYKDVWNGVDLEYDYRGTGLKESIVLNKKPQSNKFVFNLVGAKAKNNPSKPGTLLIDGSFETSLEFGALTVNVNKVGNLDNPPVKQYPSSDGSQVVVELDQSWLNEQASDAYPIVIDPPIQDINYIPGGALGQFTAYKSDGYVCSSTLCNVNTGGLIDGTTKYWRTVMRIPYDQLFGRQLLGADLYLPMVTTAGWHGTHANKTVRVTWASCSGYNCVGSGPVASATIAADGTINVTSLMGWMRDNVGSGGSLIVWGEDNNSSFKEFKPADIRLYLYTNQYPSQPSPELPSSNTSVQKLLTTAEPQLKVTKSTDPNGDPVNYGFRIKSSTGSVIWSTGEIQSRQVIIPSGILKDESSYSWDYYYGDNYWDSNWIYGGSFKIDLRTGIQKTQTYINYDSTKVSLNTGNVASSYNTHSMSSLGGEIGLNLNYSSPYNTKYGLEAEYYTSGTSNPEGPGSYRRVEPNINYDYDLGSPVTGVIPSQNFSVVWKGFFVAPATGDYQFGSNSDDYMKLNVNYSDVFTHNCCGTQWSSSTVHMNKGDVRNLTVTYANFGGPGSANLLVRGPVAEQVVPTEWLRTRPVENDKTSGLRGEYYTDDGTHTPSESRKFAEKIDTTVNYDWGTGGPSGGPTDAFYVNWEGYFTAPTHGYYYFGLASDDGARLKVNGGTVVDRWYWYDPAWDGYETYDQYGTWLNEGERVPLQLEYFEESGPAQIKLLLNSPLGSGPIDPRYLSYEDDVLPIGWNLSGDANSDVWYEKIKVGQTGDVQAIDGDGVTSTFKNTGTGFEPPINSSAVLIKNTDGTYNLTEADGKVYVFNTDGTLQIMSDPLDDRNPSALRYEYISQHGITKLRKIIDGVNSSRFGTVYYQGDAECQTPYSNADAQPPTGMACGFGTTDGRFTQFMYFYGKLGVISTPGAADSTFDYYSDGTMYTYRNEFVNDAIYSGQRPDDFSSNYMIIYDQIGRVQNMYTPKPQTSGIVMYDQYQYSPGETQLHKGNLSEPNGYSRSITYDSLFRTTSDCNILALCTTTEYDPNKDLVLAQTDTLGLKSTTIYNDVDRPTQSYGPAPAAWFETTRLPKAAYASQVPRVDTAFDEGILGPDVAYYDYESSASGKLFDAPKLHTNGINASAATLSKTWASAPIAVGAGREGWGMSMTGELRLPAAGTYQIKASHDDGVRIWIDDKLIVNDWVNGAYRDSTGSFSHDANKVHRLKVEYYNVDGTPTNNATLNLYIQQNGGFAYTNNWASYLKPGYGLSTSTLTYDGQIGNVSTAKTYSNAAYGVAQTTTIDSAGLNYQFGESYETPGTGYFRKLSKTSFGGTSTSYQNYGAGETRDNPCTTGTVEAYKQAGLAKGQTGPDPDGAGAAVARTVESVYDDTGKIVANRIGTEAWTCTTYDARGRVAQIVIPTVGTRTGRTITYNYAVGGNPMVTSVGDSSGTLTTTVDLLGRITNFVDAQGNASATTYDNNGKMTQVSSLIGNATYDYDAYERITGYNLDSVRLATISYDAYGRPSTIEYPTVKDASNNKLVLNAPTYDSLMRQTGLSYTLPDGQILSNSVTRSQSGVILDESINGIDLSNGVQGFVYDKAGRLTQANIAGKTYSYGFGSADASCASKTGNNANAGKNSNRMTSNEEGVTAWYCYDQADRLIASSNAKFDAPTYDSHGNMLTLGTSTNTTTFKYDQGDRNAEISQGSTSKIVYKRDSDNQVIRRTVTTGGATSNYYYGNAGSSDASFMYTNPTTKQIVEKYIVLPGGVRLTLRPTETTTANQMKASLANLHGDTLRTINGLGAVDSGIHLYNPFGKQIVASSAFSTANPALTLAGATSPANMQGNQTAAWAGAHKRTNESIFTIAVMQMGDRVYLPELGRFTSVDPVEGGSQNDYVYATDPVNGSDYSGQFWPIIPIIVAIVVVIARIATAVAPAVNKALQGASTAGKAISNAASKSSSAANAVVTAGKTTQQATRVGNTATKSAPVLRGYQSLNFSSSSVKHVIDRHAFGTGQTGVSVFNKVNSSEKAIKSLANEALKKGLASPDRYNRTSYIYDTGKVVGTTPTGANTTVVKVVVDPNGGLVTMFPY